MAKLPRPRRSVAAWILTVHSEPAKGREWTAAEMGDLADKYGYDTDEYLDALGPTEGYQSVQTYGPYTERQALKVAEHISEHEAVGSAIASPLHRYVPTPGEETSDGPR